MKILMKTSSLPLGAGVRFDFFCLQSSSISAYLVWSFDSNSCFQNISNRNIWRCLQFAVLLFHNRSFITTISNTERYLMWFTRYKFSVNQYQSGWMQQSYIFTRSEFKRSSVVFHQIDKQRERGERTNIFIKHKTLFNKYLESILGWIGIGSNEDGDFLFFSHSR